MGGGGGGRGKDDDEEKESETKALRSATPQSCQTIDGERSITAGDLFRSYFSAGGRYIYKVDFRSAGIRLR